MKKSTVKMGMVVNIEIADKIIDENIFDKIFDYFDYVDNKFSTYKEDSEISFINKGLIKEEEYSDDMRTVLKLSEETKKFTNGYFDIKNKDGVLDPSGLVKGWSIYNASLILKKENYKNFCVEVAGDIEVAGLNKEGGEWKAGILNPFDPEKEIVKVVSISDCGLATSGTYARGSHIYNPHKHEEELSDVVSVSVIGPNVYEADRFATVAFAMGKNGISFIESLEGFEGYMIDKDGIATFTSNFEKYIK